MNKMTKFMTTKMRTASNGKPLVPHSTCGVAARSLRAAKKKQLKKNKE